MMLNTISDEAWAFLIHESLKGELRSLQSQENLNEWQKRRFEELSNLFTSHYELAKEVGRHKKIDEAKIE